MEETTEPEMTSSSSSSPSSSDESTDEEDDCSLKLKKPTWIDSLQAILKDYPANEQILKELIQNAEDAGAKEIKFLYDAEEYPSDGLVEEDLGEFQGPALYAYNNKMFKKHDFSNLVSLQKSKKMDDRSKIGRFGRGFKSVFHMTELPCLVSRRYLGKINPSVEEKELKYKLCKLLEKHPNELKPYYHEEFGFTEAVCKKRYKGTIFRFPLRKIGSTYKVSDTVYTHEKITNIFETLKMQASMNLLFLKSLESIEVFTREPGGTTQRELTVSVTNKTDRRLKMRAKFFKDIGTRKLPKEESHVTYMIDINTSTGCPHEGTSQKFLVCHYYNNDKVSETFEKLLSDKNLSNNPIVSVAMPLKDNLSDHCFPVSEGHLFCFLPLPVDGKASPTGLPVHVNSFFAVDSKRSKIEWPTDQDGNQKLEDMPKELVWNHCLVTELLPEAYARLLQDATNEESVQGGDIYRYFPDIKEVNDKWRETLLPPFFRRALKMPLFPTVGGCNKDYVMLDDAVICPPCLDEELRRVLVKLLVKAGKKVVCPPEHVMQAIKEYCSPVEATSCYVRRILKEDHCYKELLRQEKLCLLQFLIEDNAFNDLHGLELLPAANGQFLIFCQTDSVYIVDDERRKLLPTLEGMMLSTDLDPHLEEKLHASCGQTQLRVCSDEDCLDLLPNVYPSTCLNEETIGCCEKGLEHLTTEWIEQLWHFLVKIKEEFQKSLQKVRHLHILPVGNSSPKQLLAKLSGNTVYMLNKLHGVTLREDISTSLHFFGVQVLHDLPDFVQQHQQVFNDNYVYQPHPESVMKAILKGTQVPKAQVSAIAKEFNGETTMGQRKAFRGFLQPVVNLADSTFKGLLKQLKIFETVGRHGESKCSVAVVDIDVGVVGYDLPTKPSEDLLDLSSQDSQAIAQVLGVRTLTETEVLEDIIFDDIRKHLWPPADLEKVMKLVLQKLDFHSMNKTTFIPKLKELPFLMDSNGNWRTPQEMFDCENRLLKKIFIGEDKFPGSAYTTCVAALQKLGLKTEADISGDDIVTAAKLIAGAMEESNVGGTLLSTKDLEKKAKNIFKYLNEEKNLHVLTKDVVAVLRDIAWIPVQSEKPSSYPSVVAWEKPEKLFATPVSVFPYVHVDVIGLSSLKVATSAVPEKVIQLLVGKRLLPLQDIISHLAKLVHSFAPSAENLFFLKMACAVYSELEDFDVQKVHNELQSQQLFRWLWHGDGFTSADCVVIRQMLMENLQPYVYRLPDELHKHKDWLLQMGVRESFSLTPVLVEIQQWHCNNPSLVTEERVTEDEDLAVRIINKISEQKVPDNLRGNILVPVTGGKGLTLLPAKQCTYCDTKMEKSELSVLQKSFQEDKETIHYLHPAISKATAKSLGVQSLDGRLFDGSGFDFGDEMKESGQGESLTGRIAELLEKNYCDELGMPKELIQNADDAGASEIRFLFDERQNKELRTGLLDEGMKEYQGPALWVYNNATFTEEDLANIKKLGGATKAKKRDKIGQFGLGFNAVYNITDVPSFVTGEYIVFFDPHLTHLKKVLKNDKPGLEINLCAGNSRTALLKKWFANQFKPYNGIFNCSINQEITQEPYSGTLFRLPLRPRGARSEMRNHAFSKADVKHLLQKLVEQANKLLLFTQNVKRIGVYYLSPTCSDPTNPVRLFEVEWNMLKVLKELPILTDDDLKEPVVTGDDPAELPVLSGNDSKGSAPCRILKVANKLFKDKKPLPIKPMHSCSIIETKSTFSCENVDMNCFRLVGKSSNQTWLLFCCIGIKQASLDLGQTLESCTPVAGTAVKLLRMSQDIFNPEIYCDGAPVFCHMPLPSTIQSGLPVIVNGSFALTSDRQHLLEHLQYLPPTSTGTTEDSFDTDSTSITRTTDDSAFPSEMQKDDPLRTRYQWNAVLMNDAIVEAYLGTLEQLTSFIDTSGGSDPYLLWPNKEILNRSFEPFYEGFYREIAAGQGRRSKIFYSGTGWVDFEHARVLDETLARSPLQELALILVQKYLDSRGEGNVVIVLPEKIQQGLSDLKMETFTLLQFYELAFFPAIGEVDSPGRDQLVELALVKCEEQDELRQLVQSTACIAVEALSDKFLKPGELISPGGECGKLYSMEDERFPKDVFCQGRYFDVLKSLGMAVDEIPWEEVLQRAESIQRLHVQSRSSRASDLLAYIERKLEKNKPNLDFITKMKEIEFFPILPKPKTCPLSWKGDEVECGAVGSAMKLYSQTYHYLIGNSFLIIDEKQCGLHESAGQRKDAIFNLLGLAEKVPSLSDVINTVDELSRQEVLSQNKRDIETYSQKVYSYLDEYCMDDSQSKEVTDLLGGKRCILVENHFMKPEYIARNVDITPHAPPYLSCVPHTIRKTEHLLKALGIRDKFNSDDYIDALHRIKADNLMEDKINMVRDIAECLQRCQNQERRDRLETIPAIPQLGRITPIGPQNSILLPKDSEMPDDRDDDPNMKTSRNDAGQLQLLPVGELCLRENPRLWLVASNLDLTYVHHAIPNKIAKDLGVKSDCENIVSNLGCGLGQPFGQKEELTSRIEGILKDYPCDKGVLKELLQNADDAGASELKFILDHKGQSGDRVLSDTWKELQGPSLCVYNDQPFTKKDLEGICSLGLGSKNTDPTKTGQYGIGFNSVYHLTDAPSFLTDGKEIGRTVGLLDPNCRYVPGATTENPGWCFQGDQLAKAAGSFPGSFSGYLEDNFPVDGATMFRLPLRTEEAAKESKISQKPVTFEDIEEFFVNLQAEVFQCLLFVNSVRNVSFVNTRNPDQNYWVKVDISEDDTSKVSLADFTQHMKNVSADLKSGKMLLKDVNYEEVTYTLTFNDSKERKEVWAVCQSFGFKDCNIPDEVQTAHRNGDISLLPRGGAAICKSHPSRYKHLMFCFLPLPHPENTHLSFHVNGHFALDAKRRGLLGPCKGCYRSAWNKLIIEECIAKACISLISVEWELLKKTKCPSLTDLETLYSLFPDDSGRQEGSYEHILMSAFYKKIVSSKSNCLAALALTDSGFECRWFTVNDCIAGKAVFDIPNTTGVHSHALSSKNCVKNQGSEPAKGHEPLEKSIEGILLTHQDCTAEVAVFDKPAGGANMETQQSKEDSKKENKSCTLDQLSISKILSRLGYNLLEAVPQFIFRALRAVDEKVQQVSGDHVLLFLRQFAEHSEGTLKNLPTDICQSPFLNVSNLVQIIKYCLPHDSSAPLDGLPLCLTSDNMLRVFDVDKTLFEPLHSMLIPERADLFVNKKIYYKLPMKVPRDGAGPVSLTIEHFTSLVRGMPEYKQFLEEKMEWDPSSEEGKGFNDWLQNLWKLIDQELAPDNGSPLNLSQIKCQLRPIHEFCIIPAFIEPAKRHVLYRVRDAGQVVHPNKQSSYFKSILPLLKELGVPMLSLSTVTQNWYSTYIKAIAPIIVSHQEDGVGTLNALWHLHQQNLLQLTNDDATLLLEYFSSYFHEYERHRRSADLEQSSRFPCQKLLDLPIHITVNGSIMSLKERTVFLIPPGIPKAGLDNCFADRSGKTEQFIYKGSQELVAMYVGCGCCKIDVVEIYINLLLLEINFCQLLNEAERLAHLEYIVKEVLPKFHSDSSEYSALMGALQHLPFVTDSEGQLRRARELYYPEVTLYAKMETDFPSEKFLSSELLELLKKCHLQTTVTPDELLKYAEMVEAEAQAGPTDETVQRSKLIYEELKAMDPKPMTEILDKMKIIRFLPVQKCTSKMTNLHQQHLLPPNTTYAFTCFQGSSLFTKRQQCWTVAAVLPSWVNGSSEMKETLKQLDIHNPVPVKTVVAHCTKLSKRLATRNMAQTAPSDVMGYMKVLYEYFKDPKNALDEDDYKQLASAPCIVVDEGQSLIHSRQVILGLSTDNELKPYLFKLPLELGPYYEQLLRKIGVREQPDYKHFMDVLKVIHKECQGSGDDPVLDCNQEKVVKAAITNFMQLIPKEDEISLKPDDVLFLLSRRKTLERSTDMVLVDDRRFLQEEVAQQEVVGDCGSGYIHHLQRLPLCIRPNLLSSIVEEILDESACIEQRPVETEEVCRFGHHLRNVLFLDGLKRLLYHDVVKKDDNVDRFKDSWSELRGILAYIEFFTVPTIRTVLRSRSTKEIIKNSERQSKVFMRIGEGCKVFIQQNSEEIMLSEVRDQIADYINAMMRISGETALVLVKILACSPNDIADIMDSKHITPYSEDTVSSEPELGGFIPLVQHCLLKPDYLRFLVGEIVGFECGDPLNDGKSGAATYMYAKIIGRIRSDRDDEEEDQMIYQYEVDLGVSTTVVAAMDLYKFTRNRSEAPTDIPLDLPEQKKRITADLTSAWNFLPEDKLKKILKRLVLKLQMEESGARSTEILDFIKEEVERIQRELGDENKAAIDSSSQGRNHSYPWFSTSCIFDYARERAQKHRIHIQTFQEQESCSREDDPLDFSYLRHRGKNPQPGEARRWFKQAEWDLEASKTDDGPQKAYEWALQKCHQAAEKALKAAGYTLDSTQLISHNLPYIASPLCNQRISELALEIHKEIRDGMSLRYPDRLPYPCIPHDSYKDDKYTRVFALTEELLKETEKHFIHGC